ncbi:dihydrolipoyl dehydrogenase family protein [Maritalea mediterranea]|uniref:FAD-dependent oxidoreductase n=1 Tax=Maritalea mediterranea TaxID=2909667 RepID=A0ABS9E3Q7_9HYPH|nr:FAD-dependent oxidoreductase [Maritalea mediterranea]MCF4097510.1 FAD-dependent oxidoreductase [Maritalea mediterranea]
MAKILQPDLCVMGGGSGGLTVAAAALSLGASVVLVERDKMGGDCLNYGCVPSKSLIASAKRAQHMRTATKFGIAAEDPKINFGRVHEHVHGVIADIAPHDSVERFEGLGATVLQGEAKFTDAKTVIVGEQAIKARRFVIATGSRPMSPPIPGLSDVEYYTNETIFNLTRKPQHLIVVGGGPIGMELAQAHRRLGAEVTVLEMQKPLAKDDPELTQIALKQVRREGVEICQGVKVTQVAPKGKNIVVTIEKESGETEEISGSHLLLAAGRKPNIEALALEKAKIEHDAKGIKVNSSLKTSNKRVYAIGDVAGGLQFTHVAGYHGGLVVRNALFRLPIKNDTTIIPWATYTDPEIANVGLTEADAREKYGDKFRVLRWSFAENDRARAEHVEEGLLKVITTPSGKILGAGAVGKNAGELINIYALAVANKMKIGAFTKMVSPYPTQFEIAKRIAVEFYKDKVDHPVLRFLLQFNRMLG